MLFRSVIGVGDVYVDPGLNTQLRLAGRVGTKPPATDSKVLTQPGAYLLGCHIHGSMRGHIYVADTPWAKLGGEDGRAVLQGLPEGLARVRIWHPDQLVDGTPTIVQVASNGGVVTIRTQITSARRKRAPSGDPYFSLSPGMRGIQGAYNLDGTPSTLAYADTTRSHGPMVGSSY